MPVFSKPVLFPHSNVIVSWNCNGMQSKLDSIVNYLSSYQPLLLILQETHPNSILSHLNPLRPTLNDYIKISNYTCVHAPHPSLSDFVLPSPCSLLKKRSFNHDPSSFHLSLPSLTSSRSASSSSSSSSSSSMNNIENDINNINVNDYDEDKNDSSSTSQHYDGICYLIRNDINFTTAFDEHRKKLKHILQLSPFRFKKDFIDNNFFQLCLGELQSLINQSFSSAIIKQFFKVTASFLSQIYSVIRY